MKGVCGFQRLKIIYSCFRKNLAFLRSYPKLHVLQNIATLRGCGLPGDHLKRLSEALLRTGLGVKWQDIDLRIAY